MKAVIVANTDWYLYRFRLPLVRYLQQRGIDVVLLSPRGRFSAQILAEGFRWLPWEIGRQDTNPIVELAAILSLARIFIREKPDLVHLHTIKPVLYGSLASLLIRRMAVIRSITGRGYVFLGQDGRAIILRSLIKVLYRFLLRSGWTLFENQEDRKYFIDEKMVPLDRTRLIEGVGVDVEYYQPQPEPDGIPVVAIATRMLWDKGVGTLVEAARIMHARSKVRVVLVGEPDPGNPSNISAETINHWVNEGVVEWWGWKNDMRSVFSACHIITLPSMGEGIPTVLLEAAASGRPIVTTDVAGCRDIVQDGVTGLVVPPSDPVALAEACLKLVEDASLRARMGSSGREFIVDRFSDSKINSQTFEVYQDVFK